MTEAIAEKSNPINMISVAKDEIVNHKHSAIRAAGVTIAFGELGHVLDKIGGAIPTESAPVLYGLAAAVGAVTYMSSSKKEERNALEDKENPKSWLQKLQNRPSEYLLTGVGFVGGLVGTVTAGLNSMMPKDIDPSSPVVQDVRVGAAVALFAAVATAVGSALSDKGIEGQMLRNARALNGPKPKF
jgi:hypothetical protein